MLLSQVFFSLLYFHFSHEDVHFFILFHYVAASLLASLLAYLTKKLTMCPAAVVHRVLKSCTA